MDTGAEPSPAGSVLIMAAVTRKLPRAGLAATLPAAALGPAVAAYTSVLLCDTAVPAWHEGHREMPFLFAGSATAAAGGLGMLAVRPGQGAQAARFAVLGAAAELTAKNLLLRRLGPAAEPYQKGRAGTMMKASEVLTAAGLAARCWPAGAAPPRHCPGRR